MVSVEHFKHFKDRWKEGLFVIPIHSFAAEVYDDKIEISS